MRRRLAALGVVLVTTALVSEVAHAQSGGRLVVSPSTGLREGDVVTATGGPFPELEAAVVVQCRGSVDETDVPSVLSLCEFHRAVFPSFDAAGRLQPTALPVHEVLTLQAFDPPQTYDCRVANDCVVVLAGFLSTGSLFGVRAPIRFRLPVPTTTAQCKSHGWRRLADDRGTPFRTQGQCVSFVARGRR